MRAVPFSFVALGLLTALIGMGWGIQMSATGDHMLSPAHAHLNLVGYVSLVLAGLYYAVTPHALGRLAQVHLALAVLGVAVLVPGIVLAITGRGDALAKIGSVLSLLSVALFFYVILRNGVGARSQS